MDDDSKTWKEHVKLWTDALRSGKYQQGVYFLRNSSNEFCCLGVACQVYLENNPDTDLQWTSTDNGSLYRIGGDASYIPTVVAKWFGLRTFNAEYFDTSTQTFTGLASKNDGDRLSFDQIADLIESSPDKLFEECESSD